MTREQIIDEIFSLKDEAIKLGWDWPTNDQTDGVPTEILEEYLKDLKIFLN